MGNLKPLDKKLDPWRLRLETTFHWFIIFPSCRLYWPLPQITWSWVEILDQTVHFFTVVLNWPLDALFLEDAPLNVCV